MTKPRKDPHDTGLAAEQVRAWLGLNPDFILNNLDLLIGGAVPARDLGAGVADLQRALIDRLRADLEAARNHQTELVAAGRANLASQGRVHECIGAMLSATSFEQLIQTVTTDFAVLLDVDIVMLCVEAADADNDQLDLRGLHIIPPGTVDRMIGKDRPVALHSHLAEADTGVYAGGAPLVASEALARISVSPGSPPGLVAFGSRQPDKFEAGQAVELLVFLARSLEQVIGLWLKLR